MPRIDRLNPARTTPRSALASSPRTLGVLVLVGLGALAGCAALPSSPAAAVGRDLAFAGTVVSVDTAPWAYDGSAVVVVESGAQGRIAVELPARYNLCKAQGIGAASQLTAGMKVDVNGRLTAPGRLSVCESASHHILRMP